MIQKMRDFCQKMAFTATTATNVSNTLFAQNHSKTTCSHPRMIGSSRF